MTAETSNQRHQIAKHKCFSRKRTKQRPGRREIWDWNQPLPLSLAQLWSARYLQNWTSCIQLYHYFSV